MSWRIIALMVSLKEQVNDYRRKQKCGHCD